MSEINEVERSEKANSRKIKYLSVSEAFKPVLSERDRQRQRNTDTDIFTKAKQITF